MTKAELPPGVDEQCRNLHAVKGKVDYMKRRAAQHKHIDVYVNTRGGRRVRLSRHLKHLQDAAEGEQEVRRQIREQPRSPRLGTTPETHALMTQWHRKHGYLINKRKRIEEVEESSGGTGLAATDLPMPMVESRLDPPPIWDRRAMSDKEFEWQRMLFMFFRDIMAPVVTGGKFVRLTSWELVMKNFFGDAFEALDEMTDDLEELPPVSFVKYQLTQMLTKLRTVPPERWINTSLHPHLSYLAIQDVQ
jgi:hypothetical protein